MRAGRSSRFGVVLAALAAVGAVTVGVLGAPDPAVGATPTASRFTAVGPLRLADTREADCGCSVVDGSTIRVAVAGRQGLPDVVTAAAVTITAVAGEQAGFVTVYPHGTPRPPISIVNVGARSVAANSAIVAVGADGSIDVYSLVPTDVVVDVTGVFTAATTATAGRFVATDPTRLLDTRGGAALADGGSVAVGLPPFVAPDAAAVAVNITSVGDVGPGYVSGGPAGAPVPPTSFINPDGSGRARAASVVLPVSASGLTLRTTSGGHLIVDLVGWFTGAGATPASDGLFVPVEPQRLLDTRATAPRIWPGGVREVGSPVSGASALVTNVTIDRADGSGFVTTFAAGTPRPATSSLNAPRRDATVSNLAITSISERGVAAFANAGTDLVVDLTGYFTGQPVPAVLPPQPNIEPVHRVLLIGDSTLGALEVVTGTRRALADVPYVLDAKNCRRLVSQGCTSDYTKIAPTTVVEAIAAAPGRFDIVVVKAGYNDPLTPFVPAVDEILAAARAKGARLTVWFTFSDSDSAYVRLLEQNNATLLALAGSDAYPDLVMADWRNYAAPATGWYIADRRHLTSLGAWATADYIARLIAHLDRRPCPAPWTPGGAIEPTCPNPDLYARATGTLPDLQRLYGI